MKKYYCPTCKKFKSRWQLKKEDDFRISYYTCRWCHNSNIYTTEQVMEKLIDTTLSEKDFNSRYGDY